MDFTKLKRELNEAKEIAMPRTAILWGPGDFLGEAIESILNSVNHWRVVKITDDYDVRTLGREMEKSNPEIVFVNLGNCHGDFLSSIGLMENTPELKVITFNPENNLIGLYTRQVIRINGKSDFLSIISGQSNPKPGGGEIKNVEK